MRKTHLKWENMNRLAYSKQKKDQLLWLIKNIMLNVTYLCTCYLWKLLFFPPFEICPVVHTSYSLWLCVLSLVSLFCLWQQHLDAQNSNLTTAYNIPQSVWCHHNPLPHSDVMESSETSLSVRFGRNSAQLMGGGSWSCRCPVLAPRPAHTNNNGDKRPMKP